MTKTRKVKFIAAGDFHMEDWTRFSVNHSRLDQSLSVLEALYNLCVKHLCFNLLFTGDLFENPEALSNIVITSTFKKYKQWLENVKVYAISGNHEQFEIKDR